MAIRLITGVPGAGKTYYMVNHIIENYCIKFGDTYELKSEFLIISNIDELMLNFVNVDEAIKEANTLEKFFCVENQKKIAEKYKDKKIIYILDEAQKYFHRRYYKRETFEFFEYHRHLGFDIFLLSQNSNLIAKDLLGLLEIEIRAIPRTLTIASFLYMKKSNKEIIGRVLLRRKKAVFQLYKSMTKEESEKIKSPYIKYIIPVIILFFFGAYGLKNSFFGQAVAGVSPAGTEKMNDAKSNSQQNTNPPYHQSSKNLQYAKQFENNKNAGFVKKFVQVSFYRENNQNIIFDNETQSFYAEEFFPVPLKKLLSKSGKVIIFAEYYFENKEK